MNSISGNTNIQESSHETQVLQSEPKGLQSKIEISNSNSPSIINAATESNTKVMLQEVVIGNNKAIPVSQNLAPSTDNFDSEKLRGTALNSVGSFTVGSHKEPSLGKIPEITYDSLMQQKVNVKTGGQNKSVTCRELANAYKGSPPDKFDGVTFSRLKTFFTSGVWLDNSKIKLALKEGNFTSESFNVSGETHGKGYRLERLKQAAPNALKSKNNEPSLHPPSIFQNIDSKDIKKMEEITIRETEKFKDNLETVKQDVVEAKKEEEGQVKEETANLASAVNTVIVATAINALSVPEISQSVVKKVIDKVIDAEALVETAVSNIVGFVQDNMVADNVGHTMLENLGTDEKQKVQRLHEVEKEIKTLEVSVEKGETSKSGDPLKEMELTKNKESLQKLEQEKASLKIIVGDLTKELANDKVGKFIPITQNNIFSAMGEHYKNLAEARNGLVDQHPNFEEYPVGVQSYLIMKGMFDSSQFMALPELSEEESGLVDFYKGALEQKGQMNAKGEIGEDFDNLLKDIEAHDKIAVTIEKKLNQASENLEFNALQNFAGVIIDKVIFPNGIPIGMVKEKLVKVGMGQSIKEVIVDAFAKVLKDQIEAYTDPNTLNILMESVLDGQLEALDEAKVKSEAKKEINKLESEIDQLISSSKGYIYDSKTNVVPILKNLTKIENIQKKHSLVDEKLKEKIIDIRVSMTESSIRGIETKTDQLKLKLDADGKKIELLNQNIEYQLTPGWLSGPNYTEAESLTKQKDEILDQMKNTHDEIRTQEGMIDQLKNKIKLEKASMYHSPSDNELATTLSNTEKTQNINHPEMTKVYKDLGIDLLSLGMPQTALIGSKVADWMGKSDEAARSGQLAIESKVNEMAMAFDNKAIITGLQALTNSFVEPAPEIEPKNEDSEEVKLRVRGKLRDVAERNITQSVDDYTPGEDSWKSLLWGGGKASDTTAVNIVKDHVSSSALRLHTTTQLKPINKLLVFSLLSGLEQSINQTS
ncbi:MAG: hypothetical protein H0V82_01470 [Candidatus Protochlamydia sp.]|nr:hypothetical protein [Candidatus Protochlamydia sp.]